MAIDQFYDNKMKELNMINKDAYQTFDYFVNNHHDRITSISKIGDLQLQARQLEMYNKEIDKYDMISNPALLDQVRTNFFEKLHLDRITLDKKIELSPCINPDVPGTSKQFTSLLDLPIRKK